MDKINIKLNDIASGINKVEGGFESTRQYIDRFYERDFKPVISTVKDNQTKIAALEVELAKLKTKIAIWGSVVVIIVSAVMSIVLQKVSESF